MAVRQYIGARYVPKFYEGTHGSEWDANVQYEPLTIVTYLNNTYTSKRFVPASVGSPMANPDYWVATGMYNEQLNQVVERVNALEITVGDEDGGLVKDVNDINGEIETINGNITTINGNIETINGNITTLGDDLDDLAEEVAGLTGETIHRYILISDSYGRFPSATTSAGALFLEKVGVCSATDYVHAVPTKINDSAYVYSKDATAFLDGFDTMLSDIANICTNKTEITDIIVWGGINDSKFYTNASALQTAMDNFNNVANANFPKAKIHFYNCGINHGENADYVKQYNCNIVHRNTAITLGWHYAKNARIALFNDANRTDTTHPNASGASAVAKLMYEFIINNTEYYNVDTSQVALTCTILNGTLNTTPVLNIKWMGEVAEITVAPIGITKTNGVVVVEMTLNQGGITNTQKQEMQCKANVVVPTISADFKTITLRIPDTALANGESWSFGYMRFVAPCCEIM